MIANVANEVPAAAADVADGIAKHVFGNPPHAPIRIVGFGVDARPIAIEGDILLFGKERGSLSEIRGRFYSPEGEACGDAEKSAVSNERGEHVLDNEADPIRHFSFHAQLPYRRRVQGIAVKPACCTNMENIS
jgi:hypothetical protein